MNFFSFQLVFLLACTTLPAKVIEFYADWAWKAKGEKLFTPPPGKKEEDWSVLMKIQAAMKQCDWTIKSWDLEYYHPLLRKGDFSAFNAWEQKSAPEDLWVFWNIGGMLQDFDLSRMPKDKLVLFMWEPPTVQPTMYTPKIQALFGKIFTWDDDLVDNKTYFKFNYPVLKKRIPQITPFKQKKFCVMINTYLKDKHPQSLYGEREKVALFFEEKEGDFDLYGRFWGEEFKNWKGTVKNKTDCLKNYKFCICYENMRDVKGYITEKIFDCFMAGCVPIYWGASNVAVYIPPDCFIDRRRFADTEELYRFLKGMGPNDYARYLDRAGKFLESEASKVFSKEAFLKIFMEELIGQECCQISLE